MILKVLTFIFAPYTLAMAYLRGGGDNFDLALADIKAILRGEW